MVLAVCKFRAMETVAYFVYSDHNMYCHILALLCCCTVVVVK